MSKTVVIDLGNYNYKYKGESRGLFSSKIDTDFKADSEAYERIQFNNKITYIGIGELDREYNKASKDVTASVLYAINKATKRNEINLCLLMPIDQIMQKEQLIKKFEKQTFKFIANKQARTVKVEKCVVLPECRASYYSIDKPSEYQLFIDIGSRTVNWCSYENGKMNNSGTERIGIYDLYHAIMTLENAKGEDYTVERIEAQIKRKRIKVEDSIYQDFLKKVLNRIKAKINIKDYDVMFTGGGSVVLSGVLSKIPNIKIHPEAIYSNVDGAYKLCERMWK